MRPASWSTGIPARNKGGTAAIPKTDGLWFACSGPFGSVDGHRELASAETLMVRGRPCPHQRRHGSTSRDGRAVVGVFQSVCLSDRSGRRPELRQCGQGCPRTRDLLVSVPLCGFPTLPGLPSANAFFYNFFRHSTPEPPCFHRSRSRFLETRKTFRESANFAVPAESRRVFTPPVHPCAPGRAPRLTTTGSAAGRHP